MKQDYEKRWPGLQIEYLVYENESSYIVFLDSKLDVDWKTSEQYDLCGFQEPEKCHYILNRAAVIECIPASHLSQTNYINFKRLIGEAVARALGHDYDNATKMLDDAEDFVKARNSEASRYWLLQGTGITTLVICLIGSFLWCFRERTVSLIGHLAFYLFVSGCAGALGAQLSVITRIGRIQVDSAAGKEIHFLEAVFKILCGILSAIFVALSIYAGIFLPVFAKMGDTKVLMVLLGFIAGASERFAPSIITHIENSTLKGQKRQRQDNTKSNDKIHGGKA